MRLVATSQGSEHTLALTHHGALRSKIPQVRQTVHPHRLWRAVNADARAQWFRGAVLVRVNRFRWSPCRSTMAQPWVTAKWWLIRPPLHSICHNSTGGSSTVVRGIDPTANSTRPIFFCARGTLLLPRTSHYARQRSHPSDYMYTSNASVLGVLNLLLQQVLRVRYVLRNDLTAAGQSV
jgi:hypothetical protein